MINDRMTFDEALAECERRGLIPIQGGAVVAIVVAVVGALASAYAAYSASQAQAAQADYQKKVAREQARAAEEAGKIAESNQRDQDRRIMAAQRARIGEAGADEAIGAPLLAEMESATNAELNARRIRWSAETRSNAFQAEAVGQGFAAKNIRRQGYVSTGAALMTGAAKAYGAYGSGATSDTGTNYGSSYTGYQSYRTGERGY